MKRYKIPQEFNGRISSSEARYLDQYVHTVGGIHLNDATWADEGICVAEKVLPFTGTMNIKAAYTYPGKIPTAQFKVYQNNVLVGNPTNFAVTAGDVLRVELTISWSVSANYIGLEHAYNVTP